MPEPQPNTYSVTVEHPECGRTIIAMIYVEAFNANGAYLEAKRILSEATLTPRIRKVRV